MATILLNTLIHATWYKMVYHPIRQLLLMTFLGFTAQEFFTSFNEFKPFLDPPYPCLNRASKHFQELRINEYQVFDNLTKHDKYRRPLAIFKCDCGFIYLRLYPDKSEDDKYRYSSIRQHGKIWKDKLKKLRVDLSIPATDIGKQLGVCGTTVIRYAIRYKLEMNTEKSRTVEGYKRHQNPRLLFSQIKKNYRENWIRIRFKFPNLSRRDLIKKGGSVYRWLRRNDWDWIEKHLPKSRKVGNTEEKLNWSQIDLELCEKVKKACKEIKSIKEFPVRISIAEIMKRVGNRVWLDKRHKKLPLTKKLIERNIESWENFMLKKVKWGKEFFIKSNKLPTLHQFKIKASLRNLTSFNSPKVQKEIQDALTEIKSKLFL